MDTDECIFCKVIEGTIPCEKIYEDEHTLAFLDIHPINRGHTLVIPKKHTTSIYDIARKDFEYLMGIVRDLAPKIGQTVKANGINIGMNNDRAAGQLVFHAHVHIIPRFNNDGFKHWYGAPYKDGEIANVGDALREAIQKN